MTSPNAPHIHYLREGEHTHLYVQEPVEYVYEPVERWTRVDLTRGTVQPGGEAPPDGLPQLFSMNEVEEILDHYRASLEAALGTSREGMFDVDRIHDATELVDAIPHDDLKSGVLAEAICPVD